MTSVNDYIQLLSKSVRMFDYFGKIFDYNPQFSYSPWNIRNSRFSLWILRRPDFKRIRLEEKGMGKFSEKISKGELRVYKRCGQCKKEEDGAGGEA